MAIVAVHGEVKAGETEGLDDIDSRRNLGFDNGTVLGIKERMHQARTGFRLQQDRRLEELERSVPVLQQQLAQAQAEAAQWKAKYEDLKQRALVSTP